MTEIVKVPHDFGAVGDGVTNDTTAIQNFLTYLKDGGVGSWNNLSYKVNEGTLALQPTSAAGDTIGPTFLGHARFIAAGASDAAILTIKNPDFVSSRAIYRDGNLGSVEFTDPNSTGSNRHGLSLSGCFGWTGSIVGNTLHGSVIVIPLRTSPGNVDEYEVWGCSFHIRNNGSINTVKNLNTVAGSVSSFAYESHSSSDGYLAGAGDEIMLSQIALGNDAGWGFIFPAISGSTGRHAVIDVGEIDTVVEGAFKIEKLTDSSITRQRISARVVSGVCNPKQAGVKIGLGASGGDLCDNVYIDMSYRIMPGMTLALLKPALDCTNSPNIANLTVNIRPDDQAGILPATLAGKGAALVANVKSTVTPVKIMIDGVTYINQ